ncbi:hypothetical protein [Thiocapsa sp.]|uniref:hypothetical protein n=1 Tax=Thiocapsa sp. TaxID=2024551 RepID=UPI0035933775
MLEVDDVVRRMVRASSSIERPWLAARRRSFALMESSRLWIVMLAISLFPASKDDFIVINDI